MEYVQNLPLDRDFVVYSRKAMRQAMEYCEYHKVLIDIYLYPYKTLDSNVQYS